MPQADARRKRCAVYTRKSSEEGLEQEFNSLAAQREACEAFIRSQRNEGWVLARTRYDDGGFSGGNMERPALQGVLADLRAGRIDIVIVYKVDRLTRSLADFARLVEIFDAQGTLFVGDAAVQYNELDGPPDAQCSAVLCPVRAGGYRRTQMRTAGLMAGQ
jgi:site-specific DNA recombinase